MIEFKDNEDYCRWNDILITPEKSIELFGGDLLDDSCILEDSSYVIYDGDDIFVEAFGIKEAIIKWLESQSFETYEHSFADRLAEQHGFVDVKTNKMLHADVIDEIQNIQLLDKSKYNLDLYFQFKQELDQHYDRYK